MNQILIPEQALLIDPNDTEEMTRILSRARRVETTYNGEFSLFSKNSIEVKFVSLPSQPEIDPQTTFNLNPAPAPVAGNSAEF